MKIFRIFLILILFLANQSFADSSFIVRSDKIESLEIKRENNLPIFTDIVFKHKNHFLVTASENLICVWDLKKLERISRHYNKDFAKINKIAANNETNTAYLACGISGQSGKVLKLNLKNGEFEIITQSDDEFYAISLSPDENFLAASSLDGKFIIYNLKENKIIFENKNESQKFISLDFNFNSTFLACLKADGQIFVRSHEDEFQNLTANFSTQTASDALKFFQGNAKDLAVISGFGENSKLIIMRAFLDRRNTEILLPNINPNAHYTRHSGNPIVIAGKNGALISVKTNAKKGEYTEFENMHTRLEAVAEGTLSNAIAASANGEIFIWQNYNGLLVGGIVILDALANDYASFCVQGYVLSTKEDSIKFIGKEKSSDELKKEFLNKEKLETFMLSKFFKNPPKKENKKASEAKK